jgi:hypothetical protein
LENKSDEKGDPQDQVVAKEDSERLHTLKEIRKFSRQITELNPKFTSYCEQVLRTWCASGEEGQLKLACFAEAVGKDMGKLPIPVDALTDLSKVFVKMPELGIKEKLGFLRKIYWDVLTVINLGPEALEIPFGYLSNMSTGMVNQVLLDENPKMKALVSLYMPSSLRESYLQSLDKEMKRTLLDAAAQMTEIPTDEFRSMDVAVKGKLKPQDNKGTIPLNMGLSKLVSALSPLEEIAILPTMTGPAFDNLKRTLPSIAFLPQWPDDKVSLLVSRAMPDELVAYFRSCPEVADRFIGLAPQMTAELAKDELGRPDTMAEKDKIRLLTELGNRIKELIQSKEVDLEQIFPASAPNAGGQVVGSIGKASEGSDGTQNAA